MAALTTLPTNLASATAGTSEAPAVRVVRARPTRYLLAGTGIACVGIASVNVFIPGMPTTVFLIIAVWCFARSSPKLTDRLVRNRLFGPFVRYLQPGAHMPLRAKIIACTMMWLAITASSILVLYRGAPAFVPAIIVALGLVGTICIVRQGRDSRCTAR